MMLVFATRPSLLSGFEAFILDFVLCRELRSLDSEIMLYRIENLIPQVFPPHKLNMEWIVYQGAYIRTMSLIFVESFIQNALTALKSGDPSGAERLDSLETLAKKLIDMNFEPYCEKADMPYTNQHRIKLRFWQALIVML